MSLRETAAASTAALDAKPILRGVLLLTVPQDSNAAPNAVYSSGATAVIWVESICLALAGLYLTYVGWKPEPRTPRAMASSPQDRPHAAGD
jgi:hypothetical protein